ncbi:MAG: hypothetical protein WA584_00850 [Pyrinomonadaceae bacterium]
MDIKESEQYYRKLSEEDRIFTLLNYDEAFTAIQDEVNHLAISDGISEEVHEVLNRIEALARHRYDFRTEEQKERVKSREFRKSAKIIDSFLKRINKKL